jgi:hypothetical protein
MPGNSVLTSEVSNSKVAAIFADARSARAMAASIRDTLQLSDAQVQVVTPADAGPGRKLEPESHGIFRTMIRAHVVLGLAGAVAGAAAFAVFMAMGIPFIVNSAVMSAALLVGFGAVAGLMFGGLVTLRPDHDPLINKVQHAIGEGRSAVVVHAFSHEQSAQARELLRQSSDDVVSTL